jgi:hypothetical protein
LISGEVAPFSDEVEIGDAAGYWSRRVYVVITVMVALQGIRKVWRCRIDGRSKGMGTITELLWVYIFPLPATPYNTSGAVGLFWTHRSR